MFDREGTGRDILNGLRLVFFQEGALQETLRMPEKFPPTDLDLEVLVRRVRKLANAYPLIQRISLHELEGELPRYLISVDVENLCGIIHVLPEIDWNSTVPCKRKGNPLVHCNPTDDDRKLCTKLCEKPKQLAHIISALVGHARYAQCR